MKQQQRQQKAGPARGGGDAAARRQWLAHAGVVVVACALAFGPVLWNDFTSWDDYDTIARNAHFNPPTFAGLGHYWTHPHMHLYVPVTYTAWWGLALIAHAAGDGTLAAWPFHLASMIVHALTSLVVLAVVRRLVPSATAALLGALLFAVHPVQVESVAWTSGLKDLLCGLLIWTAVWQYLRFATAARDASAGGAGGATVVGWPGRPAAAYALATAAFVIGMLAKPTAIVTPLLAVAVDLLAVGRPWRRVLAAAGPWAVLAVPCAVWTARVQPPSPEVPQVSPALRPLVAADALAFYAYKLVWPVALTVDHGRRPDVVVASGRAHVTLLATAALAAGLMWLYLRARRRHRQEREAPQRATTRPAADGVAPGVVLLAGAIFVICLGPVLGLRPFDFQQYSTVSEHYLYPAMAGPALLAAALLAGWLEPPGRRSARVARGAAMAVLAVLVLRSHVQAYVWRDTVELFAHAAAVNPRSYAAYNSLRAVHVERGEGDAAVGHARAALELRPNEARAHVGLAAALNLKRDLPAAVAAARRATDLGPNDPFVHGNAAGIFAAAGDTDAARRAARRAIELDPDDLQGRLNLGTLLYQENRYEDAARELREAVRIDPQSGLARTNLGYTLLELGRPAEAAEQFREALKLDPRSALAREGLERATRAGGGAGAGRPGR
jgi:Flp pilus assembly protein TadD